MTLKVPTVSYIHVAHLVPHPVLYFPDVVHSTRKQRAYPERTPGTCTSFLFSIAGNINEF